MVHLTTYVSVALAATSCVSSAVIPPRDISLQEIATVIEDALGLNKGGANGQGGSGGNDGKGGKGGKGADNGKGKGADGKGAAKTGKALYFMTNAADNGIVALPIGKDGKLGQGSITPTGGKGATEVDPKTGKPTVPDGLASQGAVRVVGNNVFAVNPGSNTVTMMAIDAKDPTKLTMVGQPADTAGEFPVTMTVSDKNNLVCVANTGAKAGVACAPMDAKTGIGKMDQLRPFQLNQKTPPTGPLNTVADLFMNENQDTVLATVKGDPTVNNTGFLSAFAVQGAAGAAGKMGGMAGMAGKDAAAAGGAGQGQATVSQQEVRSSPPGTAVLFGTVPIPAAVAAAAGGDKAAAAGGDKKAAAAGGMMMDMGGAAGAAGGNAEQLFATDASFGAAILNLDKRTKQASVKVKTPLNDQKATCWVTISKKTNTAFVTDVGKNRLVEMDVNSGQIIKETDLNSTAPAAAAPAAAGGMMMGGMNMDPAATPSPPAKREAPPAASASPAAAPPAAAAAGADGTNPIPNQNPGMIDIESAGDFVYALSPGNDQVKSAVAVFDVSGGKGTAKQIQNFEPQGVTDTAQGMAALQ